MHFTARISDGRSVNWANGILTGDEELIEVIQLGVAEQWPVMFDYWGAREPSLAEPFDAYITIGSILQGYDVEQAPIFSDVPDNPDGYEEEGIQTPPPTGVVAAAWRHLNRPT